MRERDETIRLFERVLDVALVDEEFRVRLQRDSLSTLRPYGLAGEDAAVLGTLNQVLLEEKGVRVRRFRSILKREVCARIIGGSGLG